MARNVFILGAGCSVHAGAPVMANFLDVAEDLYWKYKGNNEINRFEKILAFISQLQHFNAKIRIDTRNIESLYNTLEMAITMNKLLEYSRDEILQLRNELIHLITTTLEYKILYRTVSERIYPDVIYEKFIRNCIKETDSSIITFNYDCALDFALYWSGINIDYCLEDHQSSQFCLMKLHGSLNWGIEKDQNNDNEIIRPILFRHIQDHFRFATNGKEMIPLPLKDYFEKKVNLYKNLQSTRFIVPPTWNKTNFHKGIEKVWHSATKELNEAQNIFIIGYSFPETDSFFHYLLALGLAGESRIKRFWVFNPDTSALKRFEQRLGPVLLDRFDANPSYFESSIDLISSVVH